MNEDERRMNRSAGRGRTDLALIVDAARLAGRQAALISPMLNLHKQTERER